jgi:hypothetical protein
MAITVLLAAIPGRQLHVTSHLLTRRCTCSQENIQNPQCCTPAAPNTPPGPQSLPTAVLPSCSLSYPPRSPVASNRCAAFLQPLIPPQVPTCYQPLCCLLAASHTPPGPQVSHNTSSVLNIYCVAYWTANCSKISFQEAPYGGSCKGPTMSTVSSRLAPCWWYWSGCSSGSSKVWLTAAGLCSCGWQLRGCQPPGGRQLQLRARLRQWQLSGAVPRWWHVLEAVVLWLPAARGAGGCRGGRSLTWQLEGEAARRAGCDDGNMEGARCTGRSRLRCQQHGVRTACQQH